MKAKTEPSSQRVTRSWLAALALLGCVAAVGAVPSIASAASQPRATTAGARVLAVAYMATSGGHLGASNGVAIDVPPGVLTRPGIVVISSVSRGVFDIHIHAPWHGTVAVTLPLRGPNDMVLHRVGGVWLNETGAGQRTVLVTQLSSFTDFIGKTISKIGGKLCLTFSLVSFVECMAGHIDGKIKAWLESKLPHNCALELAEGFTPLGVVKAAVSGDCVGHAGDPGFHVTASPPPTSSAPPPPSPEAPSAPVSLTAPPTPPEEQPPAPPASPSISASKGGWFRGGYTLDIQVHNFPTGTYVYQCIDNSGPGGSETVFFSHAVSVEDPDQSTWPGVFCYDSAPYVAYLTLDGVQSNAVQF